MGESYHIGIEIACEWVDHTSLPTTSLKSED